MRKINLLIPLHTLPSIQSYMTIELGNLLPALRSKAEVYVTWLVYQADKLEMPIQSNENETILDIHNYSNAVEILQEIKPDLIYAAATWDLLDYSLSSAGKFLKIPVLGMFRNFPGMDRPQKTLIKSCIERFFESSTPTDNKKNKKQFMRRGRFYMYKYFFLFKTLNATNLNLFQSIKKCFIVFQLLLSPKANLVDSRFANTLHWLENESLIEPLLKNGFDKSSLVVTGNPMYDYSYRKIQQFQSLKKSDKIRVLLLPSTQYEHGFWTKKQRDFVISEMIKQILENKDKFDLTIKIHPSTASLSEYESLVQSIDSSIKIHQTGEVLDFLNNADVVVSFWFGSSETYTILAKKPLVTCNFFNENIGVLLHRKLSLECTELENLVDSIQEAFLSNPASDEKREKYLQEVIGKWDGKASERVSDAILSLLEKNPNVNL